MEIFVFYLKYYIIPILFLSTVFLTLLLVLKRIHYEYYKPLRQRITHKAEVFFAEMTLSNYDRETFKEKLLAFKKNVPLHKNWCKEQIIIDMIRLKHNLKSTATEPITVLYKALKLNQFSAGLIHDFRSYNKCEGFYHYQALDYKNGRSIIKPYQKSRNRVIRSNSTMAYISLSEGYHEDFQDLPEDISFLNTIKLMDILHEKKIPIPKNIDSWIANKNISIKKLGIKTMVFYNYKNAASDIIKLLQYPNDSLKLEVIIAVRKLFLREAETDLIQAYTELSFALQLETLTTLNVIGFEKSKNFIKQLILNEQNIDLKLKAVESLYQLDPNSLAEIAALDNDIEKMVKHVKSDLC
jgi:hypothetical protein